MNYDELERRAGMGNSKRLCICCRVGRTRGSEVWLRTIRGADFVCLHEAVVYKRLEDFLDSLRYWVVIFDETRAYSGGKAHLCP